MRLRSARVLFPVAVLLVASCSQEEPAPETARPGGTSQTGKPGAAVAVAHNDDGTPTGGEPGRVKLLQAGPSEEQGAAWENLEKATGTSWSIAFHPVYLTPTFLDGRIEKALAGGSPAEVAFSFLKGNRALFGIVDERAEFRAVSTEKLKDGTTVVRLEHQISGLAVDADGYRFLFDTSGALYAITGRYVSGASNLSFAPTLDANAASQAAVDEIIRRNPGLAREKVRVSAAPIARAFPRVVGDPVPGYMVRVSGGRQGALELHVDARDGSILRAIRMDHSQSKEGHATDVDGVARTFPLQVEESNADTAETTYALVDPSGGAEVRVYNAKNEFHQNLNVLTLEELAPLLCTDTNPDGWASTDVNASDGGAAAVSVYANLRIVRDYFSAAHSWASYDGKGSPLTGTVHVMDADDPTQGWFNAHWAGDANKMNFGDGQGVPLVALDITGHEVTHGVTQATSQLRYENQSGGLNESLSDIFGCTIEHQVAPGANNTLVGESLAGAVGRSALRDMVTPGIDPDCVDNFESYYEGMDPHYSSSIGNNAWAIMTLGGTNQTSGIGVLASAGLGWEKAAKVWFDTETKHLSVDSTYEDAARGTVASAKLLFGDTSKEVKAVECAWLAVGVLKDVVCDCSVEEKPQGRALEARESSPDTKPATEDCDALTCKPVDDPGDTASENIPLTSGDRICGSSERASDQDWFAVELEAGQSFSFIVRDNYANVSVTLYDAAGKQLASSHRPFSKIDTLSGTAPAGGTFFFRVKGSLFGFGKTYTAYYTTGSPPPRPVPETLPEQGGAAGQGGNGGQGGASPDPEILADCSHSVCEYRKADGDEQTPLKASCDACTATVCQTEPYCCTQKWDIVCAYTARDVCGTTCE
jgi:Zn-dependent metalloprotease